MPDLRGNEEGIRDVLKNSKVIAVVGHSNKPDRISYQIGQYLKQAGYTVYPVNPVISQIDGNPCYASLKDVPEPIDIVNIFRRSEQLPPVAEEAVAVGAKTLWAQLGIENEDAARIALAGGLNVVMDSCIMVEHKRLAR